MYQRFFWSFCWGIFLCSLLLPNLAVSSNPKSDRLLLPDSISYPNGIAVTEDGSIFVGSVTTGAVAKIDPKTHESKLLVAPQTAIIAATSLRADEAREILWACSPDVFPDRERQPSTLVALNINTGMVIKTVTLPQDGFCNDLAIDDRGGVLVTDSFNPRLLYLPPNELEFEVWLRDESLGVDEGFGLAGIAISSDEKVYVGVFASGKLYRIRDRLVEPIQLSRQLNNPALKDTPSDNGIAVTSDGGLIVCEGNYETGNGRLLQIDLSDDLTGEIKVLAEGLDSPVNLSLNNESVWLTEGRLRSLLLLELNLPEPDSFWIGNIPLQQ